MAEECGITAGFGNTCADIKNSNGGLQQRFWIGNLGDIDRTAGEQGFTYDSSGFVSAIAFEAYGGLYEFRGIKFGQSTLSNIQRSEGGNSNFPVSFTFKTFDNTPNKKAVLEDLAVADVFVIVESSQNEFLVYGKDLGLTIESGERNSGTNPEEDTSRIITLSGTEPELEKIVFTTDYTTTLALINSYVV